MLAELLIVAGVSVVIGLVVGRVLGRQPAPLQVETIAAPVVVPPPAAKPTLVAIAPAVDPALEAELVALRARVELALRSEAAAVAERDNLLSERDGNEAARNAAQQRANQAEAARGTLQGKLTAMEQAAAATDAALAAARTERKRLDDNAVAADAAGAEVLDRLEADLARTRMEHAAVQSRLAEVERERDGLRRDADSLRRELADMSAPAFTAEPEPTIVQFAPEPELEAGDGDTAPSELELAEGALTAERAVSAALHSQIRALHGARSRALKLAKELREARAQLLAAQLRLRESGQVSLAEANDEVRGPLDLTQAAERIAARAAYPGVQSSVLATPDGLLVQGSGVHLETLAALAGELARTHRVTEGSWSSPLAVGELRSFEISDAHGMHVTVDRVAGPEPLLLATLWQDSAAAHVRDTPEWTVGAWDPARIRVPIRRRLTSRPHQRPQRAGHRKRAGKSLVSVSSPRVRGSSGKPHSDVDPTSR